MTCVIMYKDVILADSLCLCKQAATITHQPKLFMSDDMALAIIGPTVNLTLASEYFKLCRCIFKYTTLVSVEFVKQAMAALKLELCGVGGELTLFAATKHRRMSLTIDALDITIEDIAEAGTLKYSVCINNQPIITNNTDLFFIVGSGETAGHIYRDTHKDASPVQIMQYVYKQNQLVGGPLYMVDLSKLKSSELGDGWVLKPAKIVA